MTHEGVNIISLCLTNGGKNNFGKCKNTLNNHHAKRQYNDKTFGPFTQILIRSFSWLLLSKAYSEGNFTYKSMWYIHIHFKN